MGNRNITGDGATDRESVDRNALKEQQQKEKEAKIRKMAAAADARRAASAGELFPAEPLPALVYADDPKARYSLWYGNIYRFKLVYLKGPAYQEIRAEINLFMKEGKEKGMDSRMASQALMAEAADACRKWLLENGGQDTIELYFTFRELNKRWAAMKAEGAK